MTETLTGRCLCNVINYEIDAPFRDIMICHCTQCAQWTGHQVAATAVSPDRMRLTKGTNALRWYRSSDHAERGFCATCGSSLFWRRVSGDSISVMAGTLDDSANLRVSAHIFTSDQRGYVRSADAAPKHAKSVPAPPSAAHPLDSTPLDSTIE